MSSADADGDQDLVDCRICRAPGELGPGQMYFRPAIVYQELIPGAHVCDGQLEFKMNFTTGKNMARFGSGTIESGSARHAEVLARQLTVVPDREARNDSAALGARLDAAASFGDADVVAHLVRTCYVTAALASRALAEASREGHEAAAEALIAAGADPCWQDATRGGQTAVHAACLRGNEAVAALLLRAVSASGGSGGGGGGGGNGGAAQQEAGMEPGRARFALCGHTGVGGKSGEDLLREQDMGGAARRLGALAEELDRR